MILCNINSSKLFINNSNSNSKEVVPLVGVKEGPISPLSKSISCDPAIVKILIIIKLVNK